MKILLIFFLINFHMITTLISYSRPNDYLKRESIGTNNIYLAYSAFWTEKHNKEWYQPLLVWHDKRGTAQKDSIFFDTFLLFQTTIQEKSKEYQLYQKSRSDIPGQLRHWNKYLDNLFKDNEELGGLNQAVLSFCNDGILNQNFKAKVFIGIPYPDPRQENFNNDFQNPMSFENSYNRLNAIKSFLDSFKKKWNSKSFRGLELFGFYWIQESNFSDYPISVEREFIHEVSDLVHLFKLNNTDPPDYKFIIIPSMPNTMGLKIFGKPGFTREDYGACGFDAVIIQPGIIYGQNIKRVVKNYAYLSITAKKAIENNFGIAIELQPTLDNDVDKMLYAFFAHLDAGYEFGYMNSDVVKSFLFQAYSGDDEQGRAYHGLVNLYRKEIPNIEKNIQREIYDKTYQFVKGRYKPSKSNFNSSGIRKYIYPKN